MNWATALGCVMTAFAGTVLAMPVHVGNPGAEEIDTRPDRPASFDVWTTPGTRAYFRRDTKTAHSGKASLHIDSQGPKTALWKQQIKAFGGLTYHVTAWVKTKDDRETYVWPRPKTADGCWANAEATYDTVKGTTDWKRVSAEVTAPDGAAAVQLLLLTTGGKGEAWFDDVEVRDNFEELAVKGLAETIRELGELDHHPTAVEALRQAKALERQCKALSADKPLSHEERRAWIDKRRQIDLFNRQAQRDTGLAEMTRRFRSLFDDADPGYNAGWASPMQHVFLADMPVDVNVGKVGRIEAFRGEVEAIQLVLVSRSVDLKSVEITVGDLKGDGAVMNRYHVEKAARSRANGNQVWWYDTHWAIDEPLIRSRLIPWQTYKVRADGFLIWCMNRWVANDKPVETRIRSNWNPALDGVYINSSAMYIYPGVDASLRLENFRDGIEEYDLLKAAEEALQRLESSAESTRVVAALRRALELPDDFVKDAQRYSTDPKKLQERRRMLAEALVRLSTR